MTQCILFSAHPVIPAIGHLRRARLGRKRERPVVPRLYVGEKDKKDWVQTILQGKTFIFNALLVDAGNYIFAQTLIQRVNPSVNGSIMCHSRLIHHRPTLGCT